MENSIGQEIPVENKATNSDALSTEDPKNSRKISRKRLTVKLIVLHIGLWGFFIFSYAVYWAMEDIFRCFGVLKGLIGIFQLPESLIYFICAFVFMIVLIVGFCISPYPNEE